MSNRPSVLLRARSAAKSGLPAVSVTVAIVAMAAACARDSPAPAPGPEVPAVGSPAPAACPTTWVSDRPTPTRTSGPFVPTGATEALVCSYPATGTQALPIGDVHRLTTRVEEIIDYLNGLPVSEKPNVVCPASQNTEHVFVFGYADRPAAAVYLRQCALDQSGQVRYGGDIKKLTGFWGLAWNQ